MLAAVLVGLAGVGAALSVLALACLPSWYTMRTWTHEETIRTLMCMEDRSEDWRDE